MNAHSAATTKQQNNTNEQNPLAAAETAGCEPPLLFRLDGASDTIAENTETYCETRVTLELWVTDR